MNKSELVDSIAEKTELAKASTGRFLDAILETITTELQNGGQVVIPGFGTFSVSHRAERTGRNPQTGEPLIIKASRVAKFKVGNRLKEAVQEA